jgi:hypothetical protein
VLREVAKIQEHVTYDPETRANAVRALGSCPKEEFPGVLEEIINGNTTDVSPFLYGVGTNRGNSLFLWNYFKTNFPEPLISKYGTIAFILPALLRTATATMMTNEEADELEAVGKKKTGTVLDRSFVVIAGNVRATAATVEKGSESVHEALVSANT